MSKFSKLSKKIQGKENISEERADAIAAKIDQKKYGVKGMAKKAAAAKKGK